MSDYKLMSERRCWAMTTSSDGLQSRVGIITDLGESDREGCDPRLLEVLYKGPFPESRGLPCGPSIMTSKVPVP